MSVDVAGGIAPAMLVLGGGGVLDDEFGPRGRWVSYAHVRVTANVDMIDVGGRVLPVPWHGRLAVVWTGTPPVVTAVDSRAGQCKCGVG